VFHRTDHSAHQGLTLVSSSMTDNSGYARHINIRRVLLGLRERLLEPVGGIEHSIY
jgi:hypothetical protein